MSDHIPATPEEISTLVNNLIGTAAREAPSGHAQLEMLVGVLAWEGYKSTESTCTKKQAIEAAREEAKSRGPEPITASTVFDAIQGTCDRLYGEG